MADPKTDLGSVEVSATQLSEMLGITVARIGQLVASGHIPKVAKARHPLIGAVRGYVDFLRDEDRRSSKSATESGLKASKQLGQDIRNAMLLRDLIPRDDAMADLSEFLAITTAEIRGLPARITRDREVKARLEREVDDLCKRMADRAAKARRSLEDGRSDLAADGEDLAGPVGGGEPPLS